MFSETEGSRKAIGDVDVVYHDGLYHLFHLVLPNHDFIAHAVSTNGISWRRVSNALFIGDPGSWDDLMLWTMHVTPDPNCEGRWRMFYTGLSRREQGRMQRIGMATSEDLYHWRKCPVNWRDARGPADPDAIKEARRFSQAHHIDSRSAAIDVSSCFPLSPDPRHYEASVDGDRRWISFRDPFYYRENGRGWLIVSGRVDEGPLARRGCVAVLEETEANHFESMPALHAPGLYDDIEVPNLICIDEEYYLIGSIREDAKIRYWHAEKMGSQWKSYHDNVLMASGNYAGRVCRDDNGWLLWNFFTADDSDRTTHNLLPPPKRLTRTKDGLLRTKTFEVFETWSGKAVDTQRVRPLRRGSHDHQFSVDGDRLDLQSDAGFQAFVFDETLNSFRFNASFRLRGKGKCGLVFHVCEQTHDGYHVSLDLFKGVAQLRRWLTGEKGSGERMMQFKVLQSGNWYSETPGQAHIQLIAFASYLELSIDGRIVLSLADQTFHSGWLGVYLETANLCLADVQLNHLRPPDQSDEHLVEG